MNAHTEHGFVSGGIFSRLTKRFVPHKRGFRYKFILLLALVALCWLPLAILSFFVLGPDEFYRLFLRDDATHVRFFIAMPILLITGSSVNRSFDDTIATFYQSKIVDPTNADVFQRILAGVLKWRKSIVVDIIFVVLVYATFYIRETATVNDAGFYTPWLMKDHSITAAGWWYTLFSLPVLQLIFYRWFYTILLWIIFLSKVARIDLHLSSLHPDGVGGLGFLRYAQLSFVPIAFAFSTMIAAGLSNMVTFSKISIYDFKVLIIAVLIFTLFIFVLPLLLFIPQLWKIKKKYYMMYSDNAWSGAREYEKELDAFAENAENKPDASWHVDMIGSFEKTSRMNVVLIDRNVLIPFIVVVLLPFLPVIARQVPLKEIFMSLLTKLLG